MMPVRIIVTIPVLCIGLCSVIKVDDSEDPLLDAVEKVADSLILFCQVDIGWLNGSGTILLGQKSRVHESGIFHSDPCALQDHCVIM